MPQLRKHFLVVRHGIATSCTQAFEIKNEDPEQHKESDANSPLQCRKLHHQNLFC
jgi:hypothetical protein